MFIILLLYVWMKHPGHTYGGFVSTISEWGMTPSPNLIIQTFFLFIQLPMFCKIQNLMWHYSKIYKKIHGGSMIYKKHLSFCKKVQIPNRMWIKILGTNLSLNLDWIYWGFKLPWIFLKFPKILSCHCLHECKFRWPWLYVKNWIFHTRAKWIDLKLKRKDLKFNFQLTKFHIPTK
jgi:hypothetical protein